MVVDVDQSRNGDQSASVENFSPAGPRRISRAHPGDDTVFNQDRPARQFCPSVVHRDDDVAGFD